MSQSCNSFDTESESIKLAELAVSRGLLRKAAAGEEQVQDPNQFQELLNSWMTWLKQPENAPAAYSLIGAIGGGGLGMLSSFNKKDRDRNTAGSALSGALAGGLGGAGLGLLSRGVQGLSQPGDTSALNDINEEIDAAAPKMPGPLQTGLYGAAGANAGAAATTGAGSYAKGPLSTAIDDSVAKTYKPDMKPPAVPERPAPLMRSMNATAREKLKHYYRMQEYNRAMAEYQAAKSEFDTLARRYGTVQQLQQPGAAKGQWSAVRQAYNPMRLIDRLRGQAPKPMTGLMKDFSAQEVRTLAGRPTKARGKGALVGGLIGAGLPWLRYATMKNPLEE